MGTQIPFPPKEQDPQFSVRICCGQMVGWIKIPLGMEVGLGPGNFVLDGNPAPPPQKGDGAPSSSPIFSPCLLWPNGWMHQDATWYGGRPRPRRHCLRWGPSPSPKGGGALNFRPMSIVANGCMYQNTTWYGVHLSIGNIVLDGDPALPLLKGHSPPIFGQCVSKRLNELRCHLV